MEIIEASEKYIPEITKLWMEFMLFHKDFDPRFPLVKDAHVKFENHLRESIDSENSIVLVVIDDDNSAGFAVAQTSSYPPIFESCKLGMIDSIYMKSEYRRKGIGEELLGKIYEWFDKKKIDRVELSVASLNSVGFSFWKKQGYREYTYRLYLDR